MGEARRGPPGRRRAREAPLRLERRRVLQTAHELARVRGEGAALGGGDRLARDELLAERVDEVAVLRDAIVEVGARGEPGGADVADDLPLRDATAGADTRSKPREVVVHRLVPRAVL